MEKICKYLLEKELGTIYNLVYNAKTLQKEILGLGLSPEKTAEKDSEVCGFLEEAGELLNDLRNNVEDL